MSLSKCIKLTKNLSDADVTSVVDAYDSYIETMDSKEAAEHAIDDAIASVEGERTEYLELFNEQHAGVMEAAKVAEKEKNKPKVVAKPKKKVDMPFKPYTEDDISQVNNKEGDAALKEKPKLTLSKTPEGFTQADLSEKTKPKKSINADQLKRLVKIMQRDYPGTRLIDFNIFETQDEAFGPDSTKEHGVIQGGFYSDTDKIVLIAENIKDVNQAITVIRHETVGHYGLRQLLNKEGQYDKLLSRVYNARNGELKDLYDWVANSYPELIEAGDKRSIADEMLARSSEVKTESSIITKAYDLIIKLLNKIGFVFDGISRKEVESLIRSSAANLRKGTLASARAYSPTTAKRVDEVDAPTFYSQLENVLAEKLPGKGTPKQFADQINNYAKKGLVKKEEVEWSGVIEWFDLLGPKKVTKNEVVDFIRANQIKVSEVTKKEQKRSIDQILRDEFSSTMGKASNDLKALAIEISDNESTKTKPQYVKWQLTGGENYTEVLLTLPQNTNEKRLIELVSKDRDQVLMPDESSELARLREGRDSNAGYTSGHYDEKNILTHIRYNERTDTTGKKVLFIEEVQSDWHQEGRKKGYKTSEGKFRTYQKELMEKYGESSQGRTYQKLNKDERNKLDDLYDNATFTGVPDAPFKTTWPLLAIKRMIRHAAENGFDKIAWTTGEQQADRYDLSKQVDQLLYSQNDDATYKITAVIGGVANILGSSIHESKLSDNIGKEIAVKIIRGDGKSETGSTMKTLEGASLKVGGEGMKSFYDKMLPSIVNKYVKKWGGKVGVADINLGGEMEATKFKDFNDYLKNKGKDVSVHSLYITESMKESAMKGQPLFSKKPPTPNQETEDAPTGGNLGMPDETMKDKFVRVMQDNFSRIKQLQDTAGVKVKPESNIYLAEERHTGIIKEGLDLIDKEYQDKLIKIMKDNKISLDVLDSYAIAKHAEERNAYIDSINPEPHPPGSGLTTEHANEIIEELESNYTGLKEAMDIVYDLNNRTLETLVSSGLMKKEVADNLKSRWEKYVPLIVKQDEEGSRSGGGSGFSIGGSGIKQAFGHGEDSVTESPITHSFAQAQSVVVRAEKSKIGKALVKLLRDNPDPNFWTISQRTYTQFETLFGEPFEGYDQEPKDLIHELDYTKVLSITAAEKKLAATEGRAPKAVTAYRLIPESRNRDDIFSVMVEGEELLIKIKDPIIMRQLKKMNTSEINNFIRYSGAVNRYLALVFTGGNPEFLFTNFERDFLASMVTLSGEHSVGVAAKVAKGIPAAIRGITQSTFNQKGTSEMRTAYEEMSKQGGTIGFFGLDSIDSQIKNIQRKLEGNQGFYNKSRSAVFGVRDFVLDANLSMENAARLSSYVVMRDQLIANGMSRDHAMKKAASVAKNLTVNFNRKGEWAPVFNSLWLFSSVGIQGSARIVAAMKNKRIQKVVAGMAAMGYFMALYSQAMGGDDDDGIPKWDKITDYEKQTSIILMHPDGSGEYTTYKLPYGWSVFYYAGIQMHDSINVKTQGIAKTSMNMLSALFNSYNPIQGADLLDTLTPTILKPKEQAERNVNFAGKNVYPEFKYDNFARPESQKAYKGTNQLLKDLLSDLNETTGGDESHSGKIDVSPEIVKHYTKWITGGAGMFAYRTGDVATKLATGQEVEARDIPIARLFATKTPSSAFDSDRFYKAVEAVNAVKHQVKLLRGTDRYQDYKSDHNEVNKLAFQLRRHKTKIKRLRDQMDKAYLEDDRGLALEKKEEIRQTMMIFSSMYDDAIEAQNDR